jgi:hypothetical protein
MNEKDIPHEQKVAFEASFVSHPIALWFSLKFRRRHRIETRSKMSIY